MVLPPGGSAIFFVFVPNLVVFGVVRLVMTRYKWWSIKNLLFVKNFQFRKFFEISKNFHGWTVRDRDKHEAAILFRIQRRIFWATKIGDFVILKSTFSLGGATYISVTKKDIQNLKTPSRLSCPSYSEYTSCWTLYDVLLLAEIIGGATSPRCTKIVKPITPLKSASKTVTRDAILTWLKKEKFDDVILVVCVTS